MVRAQSEEKELGAGVKPGRGRGCEIGAGGEHRKSRKGGMGKR